MKTQLSTPARGYARYTDEYKEQALQLWRAIGGSAAKVAAELGILPPLLYRWARAERRLRVRSALQSSRQSSSEGSKLREPGRGFISADTKQRALRPSLLIESSTSIRPYFPSAVRK
jgi:hypothetical protein